MVIQKGHQEATTSFVAVRFSGRTLLCACQSSWRTEKVTNTLLLALVIYLTVTRKVMANNALEVDIFGTTDPHQTSSRRRRWLFGNVSGTASAATVLLLCLGGYYASTLEGVKSGRSTLPDNSKILLKREGESSHTARALTEAVLGSAVLEPEKEEEVKTSRMYSDISKIPPNYDHKQPTEEEKEALAEKYGKWHFWDGDETSRVRSSPCLQY